MCSSFFARGRKKPPRIPIELGTQYILLKVENEVEMLSVSAENRTAFPAQWVGEDVFYVLA